MFRFSASEPRLSGAPEAVARAARAAAAAILVAAVTLAPSGAVPPARAAAVAPADTGRIVNSVRVTDEGIEIDENGTVRKLDSGTGRSSRDDRDRVHVSIGNAHDIVAIKGPVISVSSDGDDLVRVFADVYVPAGQHVDGDVVAVFGSARVEGEVTGSVVAVFGAVTLGPGARVSGDAVAVGGALDMARGATVGGETVSVGFFPFHLGTPTLPFLLGAIAGGLLVNVAGGWVLFMVFANRMRRTAVTITHRTGSSLVLGLVAPPLVIITIGLLLITVIGIPGAFLLPLLYGGVLWVGQIAACYVLGGKLMHRAPGEGGRMLPLLVGSTFVALFFVAGAVLAPHAGWLRSTALAVSMAGVLLAVLLSTVGSGAFLVSRLGSRPEDPLPAEAVASVPPGPPPGGHPSDSTLSSATS
jgi:hypothetical protein